MENIINITNHLKDKIEKNGGDIYRETLNLIPTHDGAYLYKYEDNYFRAFIFVENAKTYQSAHNPMSFYNAGKAFGYFQKLLVDFPTDKLHETIVDFHNTNIRFENLKSAIESDNVKRADTAYEEILFAKKCFDEIKDDLEKANKLPDRVTHNDTKLNNIMFDEMTDEGICIIDLDTVMSGKILYDIGDAIRFGASTALEDEKDLSKVSLDINLFEKFISGFLNHTIDILTHDEINLIPFSVKLVTFEIGIRFLEDYLRGDIYFKTDTPEHNLDRTRAQFKLISDMDNKFDNMRLIVEKYRNSNDKIK